MGRGLLLCVLALAAVTVALAAFREALDEAHVMLAYLLLVLFASARHGRIVGLTLAALAFLAFNFFLLPPYRTLSVADPRDLWVLLGFLVTSAVAAQLFHRTQRLAAEVEHVAALKETDRLKDALLASVSHDLRTPLTTIRALAAEMRSDDERAVVIEEEADRLNRLVGDLLDMSRIRSGTFPLDLQIIAAEDLVGAALQRLRAVPGSDRIEVALPAAGALPVGRMDFVQSLRVLCNLLENALKHSPGEAVRLEIREESPDLVLRVLDRGAGVPDEDRERIFDPFFQGRAPARNGAGVGLGLAIARSLAEAQGGSVRHLSRAGGGSAFEFRLPLESIPK